MPFREAKYADLAPASQILGEAFKNDSFQGRYLHPELAKYPDSLTRHYLRKLRSLWARSGANEHKLFVSYKFSADGRCEECLTGIVSWSRRHAHPTPLTWGTAAWVKLTDTYNYIESYFLPDQALDPVRATILSRSWPYTKHHWTGSRAESWYLDLLAVDPAFEGQGIGRELVAWGFERARQDGVGTSCIAASGKDRFYRACGFDVQCGIAGDEGPDLEMRAELRSIGGGTIHFWDGGTEPVGVKKYGEE
ncbi:Acetyltransferase (GNAT) family [Teratosphaeria destructans]|uniref:Acetyltransferase (GNAT) family n=1 Tax=Teratosphaeria destructans TaxID=418781 RepID=A0A9W7SRD5_9PEZI|nr:Acetyltransferase (GNAT) family [Teratosphaeria destructans]